MKKVELAQCGKAEIERVGAIADESGGAKSYAGWGKTDPSVLGVLVSHILISLLWHIPRHRHTNTHGHTHPS